LQHDAPPRLTTRVTRRVPWTLSPGSDPFGSGPNPGDFSRYATGYVRRIGRTYLKP